MSSGVACLGYGLLWLQPADQQGVLSLPDAAEGGSTNDSFVSEVHTSTAAAAKLRKKRGRPRLALMSQSAVVVHKPAVAIGSGFPMTPNMNPVGYTSARLAIDCLEYMNEHLCPQFVLVDTPGNPHRLSVEHWSYFPQLVLDILISCVLVHQVVRSRLGPGLCTYESSKSSSGKPSRLKRLQLNAMTHPSLPLIYQHQHKAISALNLELQSAETRHSDVVLSIIIRLLVGTLQQSGYGWSAHQEAARTIILHRGGFKKLVKEQGFSYKFSLSMFLQVDVMNSVMKSEAQLDMRTVKQLEFIPHLDSVFEDGLSSGFCCPNEVIEYLIRINFARYLGAQTPNAREEVTVMSEDLFQQIISFSPAAWAERQVERRYRPFYASSNHDAPDSSAVEATQKMWVDLATAFQAATLLYCLETLFVYQPVPPKIPALAFAVVELGNSEDHGLDDLAKLKTTLLTMLLTALHSLWDTATKENGLWCGRFCLWPCFIAGMELDAYPTLEHERTFVCSAIFDNCARLGNLCSLDVVMLLEAVYAKSAEERKAGRQYSTPWVERLRDAGLTQEATFF